MSGQKMLYISKVKQSFLISSNHLSNFRVRFQHWFSSTRLISKLELLIKKRVTDIEKVYDFHFLREEVEKFGLQTQKLDIQKKNIKI